jgi:WD40 repeat protein
MLSLFSDSPRSKTGRYQFAGRLKGHLDAIHAMDFSHNGNYLASGGHDGVRMWNVTILKELATPPQKQHVYGPVTCIKWLTTPYDRYETICYGTVLGYLVFWRQTSRGGFQERWAERIGEGKEILDISTDEPTKEHVHLAIGARCGSVQVWRYDSIGMLSIIFSVKIGETIPRKVVFTSEDKYVRVFGFYNGQM